ncbi:alpha/beta fold hydrolase [Roseovarius faecimaris]|uniref:Alpha/beta fold hydrolase n=1 Tax=Roseovarius faecimaris TaxID=2494550 RepID=A0A6I6ISK8_9RHOB|nr:alpha/beta fold hydrolase [Roseovarius faecimaris]QGX99124.1 alpha/beta fold hydrolase [Roseovarius faecimaris]
MVARTDELIRLDPAPHRRAGSGTPLVLVHGFLGGSAQWEAEIERFSGSHDVIAPDLPGFGEAAGLAARKGVDGLADYVIEFLDKLGISTFALLGHSMGGMIVQTIAAKIPDRVEKLVLYGTGPLGLMPNRFETIEESRQRFRADGVAKTIRRVGATWVLDAETDAGRAVVAQLARVGDPASSEAALMAYDGMETWDGRGNLEGMSMPTLILWGDTDRSYRWPQVEEMWTKIPNAKLAVIPGTSHAAHLEKPCLFHCLLADFLN